MESSRVALLLALAFLAMGAVAADGDEFLEEESGPSESTSENTIRPYYKRTLSVQGVVYCQDCIQKGTISLHGAKPLEGSRVKLVCRDRKDKTFLYDTATTDQNGYFLLSIIDFDFRNHDAMRTCRVFLLSSSSPTCSRRTNINTRRYGAFLRDEKMYPSQVLYSAGPFAFAPWGKCAKNTNTEDSNPTSEEPLSSGYGSTSSEDES
ncbi:hypothetical protein KP509_31G038000 [Ceratopteris richardii]|uniref:Uncharacterized protein n=1 Tax=Ceratopteris richardii TaxID=49495 RepID=A0A8T2QX73_CERRI|nr:hypothetical protein KP509_31G038000 [Ceratopteris richardii]